MHYDTHRRTKRRWLLFWLFPVFLTACSLSEAPQLDAAPPEYTSVASVTIDAGTTEAELEALHGGDVILFDQDAGFAVLGFTGDRVRLSTLAFEQNQDAFELPELTAEGVSAWAGGARAWAGGASAWAGGASAWAGGASAWAGGARAWAGGVAPDNLTYSPLDNAGAWQQIGLLEAHTDLAPHLGAGVVVAVIDTGIDLEHPVFAGRIVPGWDFIDNDAVPQDEGTGTNFGHGTAVAGVIAQVAPLASIMPLRVLDAEGLGDTDDLVLAIHWALEHGADVINLSLGSQASSGAVEKILEKAKKAGVAVVASAGNSGDENVTFPARGAVKGSKYKDTLVSVGSVNAQDEKSAFSTFQKDMVETVAPGEFIFTAYPGNSIIYWSGTSFAAPMVSGALALALGEPTLDKKVKDLPKLVTEKVMDKLYDVQANRGRFKDELGKGRLDLVKFLNSVLE